MSEDNTNTSETRATADSIRYMSNSKQLQWVTYSFVCRCLATEAMKTGAKRRYYFHGCKGAFVWVKRYITISV